MYPTRRAAPKPSATLTRHDKKERNVRWKTANRLDPHKIQPNKPSPNQPPCVSAHPVLHDESSSTPSRADCSPCKLNSSRLPPSAVLSLLPSIWVVDVLERNKTDVWARAGKPHGASGKREPPRGLNHIFSRSRGGGRGYCCLWWCGGWAQLVLLRALSQPLPKVSEYRSPPLFSSCRSVVSAVEACGLAFVCRSCVLVVPLGTVRRENTRKSKVGWCAADKGLAGLRPHARVLRARAVEGGRPVLLAKLLTKLLPWTVAGIDFNRHPQSIPSLSISSSSP